MSCDNKNPLQRNGTSQQQRMPEALKEGYVQVDERDYKEWIEFAGQFAKWINYIDKTNKVNGNWQPFFGSDISAVLGTIAIQDIDEYRRSFKERFDMLRADKNKPKTDLLKETFNELFGGIFTLCIALDTAAKKLPDNNPLKEIIQNLVRTQLENGFRQLLEIYKGASMAGLVKNNPSRDWIILNKQVLNPSAILAQEQLSELWIKKASTLSDYYNAVSLQANTEIYGTGSELYQKIHHIVNHNLFTGIFDQFLKAYTRIINDAEKLLMKTLTRWNDHTPHYTLFLAFLKLFRYSKAGINSITQRHLDFYYKEVLRLTHRAEIPDHAHLIMELAKQVNEYMLDKGTLFKAGKDSQGKDLVYALDKDTVFNKATVAALMNVYEGDDNDTTEDKVTSKKIMNAGRLFAAGTANSQDGKGAELKSLNKEWHPFFIKTYKEGKLTSIDTPHAQVGFAVASHYLYLTEGERTIDLTMEFANTYKFSPNATTFECYATTEKGWYLIKVNEVFHGTNSSGKLYYTIRFILKGNEPAITNYMAAVHGGSFDCKLPVIKIYLTNNDTITYPYDLLRNLEMNAIKVKVTVGNTNAYSQLGLKQLSVTNDVGLVDTSKPFQPFGALPTAASSLIIGNKELFCKKNAAMTLNIEWKDLPGNKHNIVFKGGTPPRVTVKHLANGTWIKDLDTTLFDGITERVKVAGTGGQPITVADQTIVDFADAYLPYDGKSNKGFLKLSLEKGFGNDAYQNARIIYLINLAKKTNGPAPPAPPLYTFDQFALYQLYCFHRK